MAQPIALSAFSMNTIGHLSTGLWRHPRDEARRYRDIDYWIQLAQTLERGKIDALFLADVLGVYDVYGGNNDAALRAGAQIPLNDPSSLIPAMAAATEHLGFAMTAAVSHEHPYPFARRMSTLDHLTRGRVGWNVVTGYLESGALNFGVSAQEAHDRRYDIADEYLEVCYKLWEDSWADDAVIADAGAGIYADPRRVRPIEHRGEFFTVPGIHLSEPSPQRTPVIYQAGASPRGVEFAAAHGEGIFVSAPSKVVLAGQVASVRAALRAAGRDPLGVTVLAQLTVVVAETDARGRASCRTSTSMSPPSWAPSLSCRAGRVSTSARSSSTRTSKIKRATPFSRRSRRSRAPTPTGRGAFERLRTSSGWEATAPSSSVRPRVSPTGSSRGSKKPG